MFGRIIDAVCNRCSNSAPQRRASLADLAREKEEAFAAFADAPYPGRAKSPEERAKMDVEYRLAEAEWHAAAERYFSALKDEVEAKRKTR